MLVSLTGPFSADFEPNVVLFMCKTLVCYMATFKSLTSHKAMSTSANDGDDQGEIFLDEDDIVEEINVDEEGNISFHP